MAENLDLLTLVYRFGTALGIGLFIGLQREYAFRKEANTERAEIFAGARTFSLIGLLGCTGAFAASLFNAPWLLVVLLVITGLLLGIAFYVESREGAAGLTTEAAALMMLFIGMLCYTDQIVIAVILGVTTTVLLALKGQTILLARRMSQEDVHATLTFAVISAIILPLLPREGFGPPPFDVLVPYNIWLMVVFISGISFFGYILIQIIGARRGVGLTGILGGIVSSTAVTLSFSQRSRDVSGFSRTFALAILLAWTIMFLRVLVEVGVVNRRLLGYVWIPMLAAAFATLVYCAYLFYRHGLQQDEKAESFKNPFRLGPAITFGLLYAIVLLAANTAQHYLGNTGVYLSSIAAGLADVDAIALTMARLSGEGNLDLPVAARAVVLATASNTLVKAGLVLSLGTAELRRAILPGLILALVTAIGVVFLL